VLFFRDTLEWRLELQFRLLRDANEDGLRRISLRENRGLLRGGFASTNIAIRTKVNVRSDRRAGDGRHHKNQSEHARSPSLKLATYRSRGVRATGMDGRHRSP
jgi:hypothetical protein